MNQREAALLAAAERLVVLARQTQDTGQRAPAETVAMCLRAYDEAKYGSTQPTAFEHVLNDTALASRPKRRSGEERVDSFSEPLPEGETVTLLLARAAWESALGDAKLALAKCERKHRGGDPNAPCPADLALAYKRVFRARMVLQNLDDLIRQALCGHMLRPNEMPPYIFAFYGKMPAKGVKKQLKASGRRKR